MCGPPPPKQRPSAADRSLAEGAVEQSEIHQKHILPYEIEEIDRTFDRGLARTKRSLLRGRSIVDSRVSEKTMDEIGRSASMVSGTGMGAGANIVADQTADRDGLRASMSSLQTVDKGLLNQGIQDRISLLKTGNSMTATTNRGLGQLAAQQNTVNAAQMKASAATATARGKALGTLAFTVGAAGTSAWKRGGDAGIPYEDLGALGKYRRGREAAGGFNSMPQASAGGMGGLYGNSGGMSNAYNSIRMPSDNLSTSFYD